MIKRFVDITGALAGLGLLAPLLIIAALSIWLHDRGPILYRQVRVGSACRHFQIIKFRTMVVDADKIGGFSTEVGDRRVTPPGRILRRLSVDELPQLLNVLQGEMSLVGPRPDVPAQEDQYFPDEWARRHSVKPGLTGLAQAKARSLATAEERTRLDLEYVSSASVWLDVKILLLTLRQIVTKAGN